MTDEILRVVAGQGPFRAVRDLAERADVDEITARNAVLSMRRAGLVTTRERTEGDYTLIEATRSGYRMAGVATSPVGAVVGSRGATHLPSLHPGDPTDFHNQPTRAPGGPIERSRVPIERPPEPAPIRLRGAAEIDASALEYILAHPGSSVDDVRAAVGVVVSTAYRSVARLAKRGSIVVTHKPNGRSLTAAPGAPAPTPPAPAGPTQQPERRPLGVVVGDALAEAEERGRQVVLSALAADERASAADYPLIAALAARAVHVEAAARELEAAGLDAMAKNVRAVGRPTPLEAEVLRFWEARR